MGCDGTAGELDLVHLVHRDAILAGSDWQCQPASLSRTGYNFVWWRYQGCERVLALALLQGFCITIMERC